MKKMICLMMCLALLLSCLAGCGKTSEPQQTEAPAETAAPAAETEAAVTEAAQETEPESGVLENSQVPVANFEIETPYCMLTYPMTWQNYVMIRQEQTETGCIVRFYGLLDSGEQHLFDVCFGGEEGDEVGQILTDSGSLSVRFRTYSVADQESLAADEREMLLAMVEDINVIYTGLQSLSQFNG